MLSAIDLAFKLGSKTEPDLAERIVMELLRVNPETVIKAYTNVVVGVDSGKFANIPAGTLGAVITLLRCDQRVAAVKAMREATGWGLKEALDAVKGIEQELANQAC